VDEIVVLDQGKVAERDTHRVLRAGGLYRRMWDAKQTTGPGREFS
jgi:ABC-type multidrug transport system fused ATPase/permease subunit